MNTNQTLAATHLTENIHLTEEQFSDYIVGLSTEAMDLHVEQCSACRAEVLRVQDAVSMFAEAGREWSTVRPAAMPAAEAARSIRRRSMWITLRPVAGFAAAAVAIFTVTINAHRGPAATDHVAIATPHEVPITASVQGPAVISHSKIAAPAVLRSSPVAMMEPAPSIADTVAPETLVAAPSIRRGQGTSDAEVAQDNALMAAIDAEITAPYNVAPDVSRPFREQ